MFVVFLGTSDPYVKFKIAGKEVFRSKTIHKNLNPVWDEKVTLLVDNIREPLYVKVSDESRRLSLSISESLIRCAGGSGPLQLQAQGFICLQHDTRMLLGYFTLLTRAVN